MIEVGQLWHMRPHVQAWQALLLICPRHSSWMLVEDVAMCIITWLSGLSESPWCLPQVLTRAYLVSLNITVIIFSFLVLVCHICRLLISRFAILSVLCIKWRSTFWYVIQWVVIQFGAMTLRLGDEKFLGSSLALWCNNTDRIIGMMVYHWNLRCIRSGILMRLMILEVTIGLGQGSAIVRCVVFKVRLLLLLQIISLLRWGQIRDIDVTFIKSRMRIYLALIKRELIALLWFFDGFWYHR